MRDVAEREVVSFVKFKKTHKDQQPNLGCWLWYLLLSNHSWKDVNTRKLFVMESLDRNVYWTLRGGACNYLAVIEGSDDVALSANRIIETFKANKTSVRLMLFQDYFVRCIGGRVDMDEAALLNMYVLRERERE